MNKPILREKIYSIVCDQGLTKWEKQDQILALLEPRILTVDEARELLHCWKNESASLHGKVNREDPLYLKLKKIVEGPEVT